MKKIQLFRHCLVSAVAFAAPVLAQADSGYRGPQPVQNAPAPQVRVIDQDQARLEQQRQRAPQDYRSSQYMQTQPHAQAGTQAPSAPQPSRRVAGLVFDPNNRGSGPDRTKFNIVNEDEARRQQSQYNQGSGDSRTSDGTGASAGGNGR